MIVGSRTGGELFAIYINKKRKDRVSYGENDEK